METQWIEDQPCEMLRRWLERTAVPMLATSPDGDIWWANEAFENLVGYTSAEFHDSVRPIKWTDLTIDHGDLKHDIKMADELVCGSRIEYQLVKQYRSKGGESITVNIHVLRHPLHGDFDCFLVSVRPLNEGPQAMMRDLQNMQSTMMAMMEKQADHERAQKEASKDTFWAWCKANPRKAWVIGSFVSFLIAGDRVLEFMAGLKNLLIQ